MFTPCDRYYLYSISIIRSRQRDGQTSAVSAPLVLTPPTLCSPTDFAESASPSSMSSSDIPWAARSFLPYALQTLSRSIHSTVADQILDHARAPSGVRATSPERLGSAAALPLLLISGSLSCPSSCFSWFSFSGVWSYLLFFSGLRSCRFLP